MPKCLSAVLSLGSEEHRKQVMVFHSHLAQEWYFFPRFTHSLKGSGSYSLLHEAGSYFLGNEKWLFLILNIYMSSFLSHGSF